jgi:uncharacterized RDD family membrane protein YckC
MSRAPENVHTAQRRAVAVLRPGEELSVATQERDTDPGETYAGLVTRAVAFALDAAVINGCALAVGVTVGLGLSILHLPSTVDRIIAAILVAMGVIWLIAYFIFFWSTTGQTPGDRVMRIEVIGRDGRRLGPVRAATRFGWLILAAIPLLAGIWIMLWDDRRRGLHDRLARTLVIYARALGPGVEAPSAISDRYAGNGRP